MLTIRLLGAPEIVRDQRPLTLPRRKSRALLYYLAAHPAPLARERVTILFWPDLDRRTARQNLRVTLYELRKLLGDLLVMENDSLALAAEMQIDVRVFEAQLNAAIEPESLRAALALYRGDFCAFTPPALPEFEHWMTVEREHYRRLAIKGWVKLSRLYEAENLQAALETLEQALELDPLQEDLHRLDLRLRYLAGDRTGAIRQYEKLCRLLNDEMGVPPMEETRALYDAIITDTLNPAASAPSLPGQKPEIERPLPFVGRQDELRQMADLAAARKLILIEGEAGIGKSRLIAQFIQSRKTAALPCLALMGQARELESRLPYQPIIEALRSVLVQPAWLSLRSKFNLARVWRIEVSRLLPELALGSHDLPMLTQATDETRLWEGVSQFLLALGRHITLLLALDDLCWADPSTLSLLGYLARRARQEGGNIIFVAATRQVPPGSPLMVLIETLMRENYLACLSLKRLAPDQITVCARQLGAAALAEWLIKRSEGNPFILTELVRYACQNKLLLPDGAVNLAELRGAAILPQSVSTLIRSRLGRLSETSRQVLGAAAVVGREFQVQVVARAAALSDLAALDSVDEIQSLALIHPVEGARYRFDHHLTQEVVLQVMGEPRQRMYHRRVGQVFESMCPHGADAMAGLIAYHFAQGGVPERAARYAFLAGQRAFNLAAWSEAIAFYTQALAQTESLADQTQRPAILVALGQACLQAGDYAQACQALEAALSSSQNPAQENALHLHLSMALLLGSRYDQVLALADLVGASQRPENIINAEYLRGVALGYSEFDLAGAIAHLKNAATLLDQSAALVDPRVGIATLARVKYALGSMLARQGELDAAIALYRQGLVATQDLETIYAPGFYDLRIFFYNNLAYHLYLQNDPTAIDYARQGLALAQEGGFVTPLPFLLSTLGEIALAKNDLDAAEAHFDQGLAWARQFSALERVAGLTANLGRVARQRGQAQLALERLSTALTQAERLNQRYMAAQIHLWLAPLLSPPEARLHLAAARQVIEQQGYQRLLDQLTQLEATI